MRDRFVELAGTTMQSLIYPAFLGTFIVSFFLQPGEISWLRFILALVVLFYFAVLFLETEIAITKNLYSLKQFFKDIYEVFAMSLFFVVINIMPFDLWTELLNLGREEIERGGLVGEVGQRRLIFVEIMSLCLAFWMLTLLLLFSLLWRIWPLGGEELGVFRRIPGKTWPTTIILWVAMIGCFLVSSWILYILSPAVTGPGIFDPEFSNPHLPYWIPLVATFALAAHVVSEFCDIVRDLP